MPINIADFQANLPGGGARPNLFEVDLRDVSGLEKKTIAGDNTRGSFLVKATSLPATTISRIAVPYRGRNVIMPGVREFEETWSTTIINDTDFAHRKWIENWMNAIHSHETNVGEFKLDALSTDLSVYQLDHKDGSRIRGYKFINAWPSELGAIDLAADSNDAVQEYECQWAYSYWMNDEQSVTAVGDGTNTVD